MRAADERRRRKISHCRSTRGGRDSKLPTRHRVINRSSNRSIVQASKQNTKEEEMSNAATDPLNILGNPPSTFVKVHGTSRDDVNGLLGLAIQYNSERGRYMVQMALPSASTGHSNSMALKPENLQRASTFESCKARFWLLKNDPRLRQELTHYYNLVDNQYLPANIKPEHAAGGLGILLLVAVYTLGFSRTMMLCSLTLLLAMLVGPDLVSTSAVGASNKLQLVVQNFPRRCKEFIDHSLPQSLKEKVTVTNNVAAGIMIVLLLLSFKALITPTQSRAPPVPPSSSNGGSSIPSRLSIEQAYKLGFQDANDGKEFGSSMYSSIDTETPYDAMDPLFLEDDYQPPQQKRSGGFGLSQVLSLFAIYRMVTELGGNPMDGTFSTQRLIANAKATEPWRLGLFGLAVYNILKVLF